MAAESKGAPEPLSVRVKDDDDEPVTTVVDGADASLGLMMGNLKPDEAASKRFVDGKIREPLNLVALRKKLKIQSVPDQIKMEKEAGRAVREMCFFTMFALLFTFTTLLNRNDQEIYFFTEAVRNQLVAVEFPGDVVPNTAKTFEDVATVEELYQWLEGPFYSAMWTASTFDGDHSYRTDDIPVGQDLSPNRQGWIMGTGRLLGGVRIGWTRVPEDECNLPEQMISDPDLNWFGCTPTYLEARGQYQTDLVGHPASIPNQHFVTDILEEPEVTSPTTSNAFYAPKQYVVLPNLEDDQGTVKTRLHDLVNNLFIDRKFRNVVVDFNVYNPNLDYFIVGRLMAEMPVAGGVYTTHKFSTLRLYRNYTVADGVRFTIEVIVQLIVFWYTWDVIKGVRRDGARKHLGLNAFPHNLNLILFYIALSFKILAYVTRPAVLDPSSSDFIELRTTAAYMELAQDCNAFNAFLTWVKETRYLSFIPKFKILIGTLAEAASELWAFVIICMFVLFGSSQAFSLAFGTAVYGYRNLSQSFFTLARALLGDFDFEELRINKPFLGPLMFFIFVMLAVFVLLNMFIAIIGDAFSDTKASLEEPSTKARANRMLKAVVNVGLTVVFKMPYLGRFVHNRVNKVVDVSDPTTADVRDLFELLDRNMYMNGWEEYIMQVLKGVEAHHVITTADIVDSLVEMGAESDAAHSFARRIDRDGNGEITTGELDEILVRWEKVIRSRKAGPWYRKATSDGSDELEKGSGTPGRAVVPLESVVSPDAPAGVDGSLQSTKSRMFVKALTASTPSARHGAHVTGTVDDDVPHTDVSTIRKAFNHLRIIVLIRAWLDHSHESESPDALMLREAEKEEDEDEALALQRQMVQRESRISESLEEVLKRLKEVQAANVELSKEVKELKAAVQR